MDLRRLRYFVVAAEESNFRRASLRLGCNSSVVSRYVRDIEDELGADLFLREPGHGARLTEVGVTGGLRGTCPRNAETHGDALRRLELGVQSPSGVLEPTPLALHRLQHRPGRLQVR
jgi:hypothetical protein